MKRRRFITVTAHALPALGFLSHCRHRATAYPPEGEEWRADDYVFSTEYTEHTHKAILAKARQDIDKYRKESLTLRFTKGAGEPIQGITATLMQTSTPFDWGCSAAGNNPDLSTEDNARRTYYFTQLFNCTTAKCYWDEHWHQPIENTEGVRVTNVFEKEIHWAITHGLRVKGHPLVWTVRKAIPRWLDKYTYPEQIKILERHVRNIIATGGSRVTRWDICNEMLWEPSLRHYMQRKWPHIETTDEILTYLEPAMHWAREANPDAIFSLNDYGLEKTYRSEISAEEQRNRYVELVQKMLLRNCPPDAIGTQAHVAGWYSSAEFKNSLDHLARAGVPLQITEFWADPKKQQRLNNFSPREIQQAQINYVTDMYTIAFGHPAVTHFTYWGDKDLFDLHGHPTLLYQTLYQLIQKQWKTNTRRVTDANGIIHLRAFHGDYILEYNDTSNRRQKKSFTLIKNQPLFINIKV